MLGDALLILATLHALIALKHHYFDRDEVLNRMLQRQPHQRGRERLLQAERPDTACTDYVIT